MDYKIQVTDKVSVSDRINISVLKKAKEYYKKRPIILLINIILIIVGTFINPVISIIISLVAFFVLPNWKEKAIKQLI